MEGHEMKVQVFQSRRQDLLILLGLDWLRGTASAEWRLFLSPRRSIRLCFFSSFLFFSLV